MLADIIFFAAVAIFIAIRLRKVLGRTDVGRSVEDIKADIEAKIQKEKERELARQRSAPVESQTTQSIPPASETKLDELSASSAKAIAAMRKIDSSFSTGEFLKGARMAFEMIVDAYHKGDKETLKNLLSSSLYDEYAADIDKKSKRVTRDEVTLVALNDAKISKAALNGSVAKLSVTFESEQIFVTKNKEGKVIKGDPSIIETLTEEWTFERDLKSDNPNWLLVSA